MCIVTAVGELKYAGTAVIACLNHILDQLRILVVEQRNNSGTSKGVEHL